MGTGDPWLLVQHVAFEGPGAIAGAIADTGADLTVLRIDRGDAVPSPAAVADMAGLVVMGGPMSVHDDLAWLADERALLRAAVEAGRPVLGVCLGAQQLAAALGAPVTDGPGARVRRRRGPPDDGRRSAIRSSAPPRPRCPACTGTATPSACPRARCAWPATPPTRTRPSASVTAPTGCSSTWR